VAVYFKKFFVRDSVSFNISEIRFKECTITLHRTFRTALGEESYGKSIVVAVIDKRGQVGYGEASPSPRITGTTPQACIDVLDRARHFIRELTPYDIKKLHKYLQQLNVAVPEAKAALDIAMYDLKTREFGIPLWRFLGAENDTLLTDITVSLGDTEYMLQEAKMYVSKNFNILKIKVGEDPSRDVERLKILRQNIPEHVIIRIDVNQGWKSIKNVLKILEDLYKLNIQLIEQPLPRKQYSDIIHLSKVCKVPIILDESVFDIHDLRNLIQLGFQDGVNIKLMKCGGIFPALQLGYTARAFNMELMVGCMLETKVSITAAAALAAALDVEYVDLDSPLLAKDTSIKIQGGVTYDGPRIILPKDPGLGIRIDDPELG